MLKISIQVPVLPSHAQIAKLQTMLRKTVKDNEAIVNFYKDRVGSPIDVLVLKNNSEQEDLRIDCLTALMTFLLSKIK